MTGFGISRHSASKSECLHPVWNCCSLYFGYAHIAAIRLISLNDRLWPERAIQNRHATVRYVTHC